METVYKIIEIVGTSTENYEKAIANAIEKAAQTVKAISWFEVIQQRGAVHKDKITEFQVIIKVGFKLIE